MKKQSNSPSKSFEKGQGKNKSFKSQEKTIFHFLLKNTATNTMISYATGIAQGVDKCANWASRTYMEQS